MPRRNHTLLEYVVEEELKATKVKPVADFLKNTLFDYIKKADEKVECPVCFEEIDCKNCFCLLPCGHHLHLHEWLRISVCPVCRAK